MGCSTSKDTVTSVAEKKKHVGFQSQVEIGTLNEGEWSDLDNSIDIPVISNKSDLMKSKAFASTEKKTPHFKIGRKKFSKPQ